MTATICKLGAGNTGAYYTAANDYYLSPNEAVGYWAGAGAARLKLDGPVDARSFSRLLFGCHPRTGKSLFARRSQNQVPGIDITFSVPKSVSAYWACLDPQRQAMLRDLTLAAVRQTLAFAEEHLQLIRQGANGVMRSRGEISAALFPHYSSRNGDPQLHVHAVIPNLSWNGKNRYQRLNTAELFTWTRTLGPVFRANLARELRENLQLQLYLPAGPDGGPSSSFEVRGVDRSLCELWSSRKNEIDDLLKEDREAGAKPSAQQKSWANQRTRRDKKRLPKLEQLQEKWHTDVVAVGFDIGSVPTSTRKISPARLEKLFQRAFREAIRLAHQAESYFPTRQLLQHVTERLQHTGCSPDFLLTRLTEEIQHSRQLIQLRGEGLQATLTTRSMWNLEQKLLGDCQQLRSRAGVRASDQAVAQSLRDRPELSDEQIAALRDLTQRRGAIRLLQGVAGAGKSRTLDAVRQAFEDSGCRVLGGAISGIAKQNLAEQAKIESRTVASYLYQLDRGIARKVCDRLIHDLKQLAHAALDRPTHKHRPFKLTRKTVLILDEAGMNDARSLGRLLHHVRKAKATLILVGDPKQLQPIGPGGVFQHLLGKYEHPTLQTNRRQRNAVDQEAVAMVRRGEGKAALQSYRDRELLTLRATHREAAQELLAAWKQGGGVTEPRRHAILAQTRDEVRALNSACQQERRAAGQLDASQSVSIAGSDLYRHDRIMFHKRLPTQGIENGHQGEILRVAKGQRAVYVLLDEPKQGTSPVVRVPFKSLETAQVSLGYAATTHKFQGATTDYAYILMGGSAIDRNMAYTQLTRARHETRLFVGQASAGEDLQRLTDSVARERPKKLAHDITSRTT
jgi:conjugative relaxase-like TrwC/TraI family protein